MHCRQRPNQARDARGESQGVFRRAPGAAEVSGCIGCAPGGGVSVARTGVTLPHQSCAGGEVVAHPQGPFTLRSVHLVVGHSGRDTK